MVKSLAGAVVLFGAAATAAADVINVPDDFVTIQAAIDAAVNGDEVIVADGTWTGAGNRDIDFGGRLIAVRSLNGPVNCIIDCEAGGSEHRGFHFHSGETAQAVVDGFTIRNGQAGATGVSGGCGGAIRCDNSSPTIINCIIADNTAVGLNSIRGGGICTNGGSPRIINCVISGNSAQAQSITALGGAIYTESGTIANCTVHNNFVTGQFSQGGGIYGNPATIRNTIAWDNTVTQLGGTNTVTYSDVQGGVAGAGNINSDPLLVDPFNGNFRLTATSPCIDGGNNWGVPADAGDVNGDGNLAELTPQDIDGHPRFSDGPLFGTGCGAPLFTDIGAYEFPGPSFPVKLGDIGGNGSVGTNDFLNLLQHWGPCPEACCLADLNLDGQVGVADFLLLLANWG